MSRPTSSRTWTIVAVRTHATLVNGSLPYAPPLLVAAGVGVFHYRTQARQRLAVLAGAAIFGVAVIPRTIDLAVCSAFPLGAHFVWHLLVALALYVFVGGLPANLPHQATNHDGVRGHNP